MLNKYQSLSDCLIKNKFFKNNFSWNQSKILIDRNIIVQDLKFGKKRKNKKRRNDSKIKPLLSYPKRKNKFQINLLKKLVFKKLKLNKVKQLKKQFNVEVYLLMEVILL